LNRGQTRGLRISKAKSAALLLGVFLAFLALYTVTLMPDILPEDSGEFQLVAATAGLAHPPGRPLYTMLGWLFARLPLGPSLAWRVNLFSAVTAAATVAVVFQTARRLSGSVWGGLAAALTLGAATTFWATATKASIRPLTAFFASLCVYALVEHRRQVAEQNSPSDRYLAFLALALSLGLTHDTSLGFAAIVFVVYLILTDPALLRQPRRCLKPIVAFLLGLLVLVYLPLRGGPELRTLPGFLHYFLGLGFQGDFFTLNLFRRLAILPTLLRFQFNLALLLGMLVGALLLLRRDRKLALLLVGSFLVYAVIYLTYRAPQTVEYLMPAYVPLALLAAIPCGEVSNVKPQTPSRIPLFIVNCSLLVSLIAGVINLAAHLPSYRILAQSNDTREYAELLLRDAPADAVILTNWHWFKPLQYLQQIEGLRPDVAVEYVFPQGRSLAQNWVDRIEEYAPHRPVIVAHYHEQEYGQLPYRFDPFGQAFLVRAEPSFTPPPGLVPIGVTLGEQVALLGYRLEPDETEPSLPLVLTLAWSPVVAPTSDLSLFAQLIGPDGLLWSAARDPRHSAGHLVAGEVVVERFVVYSFLHAPPGQYAVVVGAYVPEERLKTGEGTDAVQLTTVRLRPSTLRPVTDRKTFVRYTGGPTLIGVDYDTGAPPLMRVYLHWAGSGAEGGLQLLDGSGAVIGQARVPALGQGQYATVALDSAGSPAKIALLDGDQPRRWNLIFDGSAPLPSPDPGDRYVPFGDAVVLTGFDGPAKVSTGTDITQGFHFLSSRPLERDYIVSAALVGVKPDGTWDWRADDDSVPALGAIPTLKWIHGSSIYDPHRLTIPSDTLSPAADGYLVIYDHFTQAPLPPLDGRFQLGHIVPLGPGTIPSP
jgi:hypothetical protein